MERLICICIKCGLIVVYLNDWATAWIWGRWVWNPHSVAAWCELLKVQVSLFHYVFSLVTIEIHPFAELLVCEAQIMHPERCGCYAYLNPSLLFYPHYKLLQGDIGFFSEIAVIQDILPCISFRNSHPSSMTHSLNAFLCQTVALAWVSHQWRPQHWRVQRSNKQTSAAHFRTEWAANGVHAATKSQASSILTEFSTSPANIWREYYFCTARVVFLSV